MKSASARLSALKNKVVSRGFKVQLSNSVAATSNLRGVVPCLLNFDQLVYKTRRCQTTAENCNSQPPLYDDNQTTPTNIDGGNPFSPGTVILDGGVLGDNRKPSIIYDGGVVIVYPIAISPVSQPAPEIQPQPVRRISRTIQGGTPTSTNIFSNDGGSPFRSNYTIQDGGGP